MGSTDGMRIDELAQRAGVASTTIRLYQHKGLLPGPRLDGRTGYYDESHLARLRLIHRLQEDGFSLAGIGRLLASWEEGRDLRDLVQVEEQLDALLTPRQDEVLEPAELFERFPAGAVGPEHVQRAVALRLIEPTDDGRIRVLDRRFLESGAALARLGIPADEILDQWEHLVDATDELAGRFVDLFERHLLPADWRRGLDAEAVRDLAATLATLRRTAGQVLVAALDSSLARVGAQRLGDLLPTDD